MTKVGWGPNAWKAAVAARREKREVQSLLVPCLWPDCANTTKLYRSQARTGSIRERGKTLCRDHRAIIKNIVGDIRLNAIGRALAAKDRVYQTRAVAAAMKVVVFLLHNCRCGACHTPLVFSQRDRWHVDHIVPRFRGGLTTLQNLMPLCRPCHKTKTSEEMREWRPWARAGKGKHHLLEWANHAVKDTTITRLEAEVADLKAQIATLSQSRGATS